MHGKATGNPALCFFLQPTAASGAMLFGAESKNCMFPSSIVIVDISLLFLAVSAA